MTAAANQITKSLVTNIENAAKFVVALKSLMWTVASRSPRPRINIINDVDNNPVPGPKKKAIIKSNESDTHDCENSKRRRVIHCCLW